MSARAWSASALGRIENGREMDGNQSSLTGSSGPEAQSGRGLPQSKTLSRVMEAWMGCQVVGLRVHTVFTNAQLASMVQMPAATQVELVRIDGIVQITLESSGVRLMAILDAGPRRYPYETCRSTI